MSKSLSSILIVVGVINDSFPVPSCRPRAGAEADNDGGAHTFNKVNQLLQLIKNLLECHEPKSFHEPNIAMNKIVNTRFTGWSLPMANLINHNLINRMITLTFKYWQLYAGRIETSAKKATIIFSQVLRRVDRQD